MSKTRKEINKEYYVLIKKIESAGYVVFLTMSSIKILKPPLYNMVAFFQIDRKKEWWKNTNKKQQLIFLKNFINNNQK